MPLAHERFLLVSLADYGDRGGRQAMSASPGTPAAPVTPCRTYPRRASPAVLRAGALMTILDGAILTMAMPAVQRGLGISGPGGRPEW